MRGAARLMQPIGVISGMRAYLRQDARSRARKDRRVSSLRRRTATVG